jgi:hypothetical protein
MNNTNAQTALLASAYTAFPVTTTELLIEKAAQFKDWLDAFDNIEAEKKDPRLRQRTMLRNPKSGTVWGAITYTDGDFPPSELDRLVAITGESPDEIRNWPNITITPGKFYTVGNGGVTNSPLPYVVDPNVPIELSGMIAVGNQPGDDPRLISYTQDAVDELLRGAYDRALSDVVNVIRGSESILKELSADSLDYLNNQYRALRERNA